MQYPTVSFGLPLGVDIFGFCLGRLERSPARYELAIKDLMSELQSNDIVRHFVGLDMRSYLDLRQVGRTVPRSRLHCCRKQGKPTRQIDRPLAHFRIHRRPPFVIYTQCSVLVSLDHRLRLTNHQNKPRLIRAQFLRSLRPLPFYAFLSASSAAQRGCLQQQQIGPSWAFRF